MLENPAEIPLDILLVEDNLGDVELTLEAFKNSGRPFRIQRVQDGEEALAYLNKEGPYASQPSPALILLDLNMPKKTGLEVLEEIRLDPRMNDIPIVVLTNSKADSDIERAYQSRANFYIVKPADLELFFTAVKYVQDTWLRNVPINMK